VFVVCDVCAVYIVRRGNANEDARNAGMQECGEECNWDEEIGRKYAV
jgi:hypothetical protein